MTRDELLEALLLERQTSPWWSRGSPPAPEWDDSEMTCARRRRELVGATYDDEEVKTA